MHKNKLLKTILSVVIACSVIEMVGLSVTIAMGSIQKKKYKNIINNEYDITQEVNNITSNVYKLQNTLYNYTSINSEAEDYQDEIDNIRKLISSSFQVLEEDAQGLDNESIYSTLSQTNEKYGNLEENIDSILSGILNGTSYSPKDIHHIVDQEARSIHGNCSIIQSYIELDKEEELDSINMLETVSSIANNSILVVLLLSIIVCLVTVRIKGQQMADLQASAEKDAKSSKEIAYKDALTGLWNRKYTEEQVEICLKKNLPGCLFMMDMDNFKSVNDTYGHIAGDTVLKTFGDVLVKSSRSTDTCCRIGGDEFIVYAKGISKGQAVLLAERIIKNADVDLKAVEGGTNVTVSIGAAMVTSDITDFKCLYDKADDALYYIKRNGKNDYNFAN